MWLVDPWGMLPVHLPLARVPISTNARFSFPALAVSGRFDAAVLGSSTSRLLAPALLDPLLDARFANLAMNAATPWEQGRMLLLFARHHPRARAVVIGLDQAWCLADATTPKLTGRPFPTWMYGGTAWAGYARMLNLYAVQESANQLATALGWKRRHYGLDGYTNFLPPDGAYDPARVAALFRAFGPLPTAPATGPAPVPSYVDDLPSLLGRLPAGARKLLFFPPIALEWMGAPGTDWRRHWDVCKRHAVASVSAIPNAVLLDYAILDRITLDHANFWDPLHYRIAIAAEIARDLALAASGGTPTRDVRVIARGPVVR